VGTSPAQPSGVLALKLSTVRAGFGILGNPFTYNKAVPFTESQFHYAFGNALDKTDSKVLWEKYSVPAAAHILGQGALGVLGGGDGAVEWKKANRAPLLLIAGTNDHVVPREVVEAEKKHMVGWRWWS
jgi:non-heme chloroperoxidase